MPISDDGNDPVSRTRRQLKCYYECVVHGHRFEPGDDCPGCDDLELDEELEDDDDELGLPRY